jgi:hypothetical protein
MSSARWGDFASPEMSRSDQSINGIAVATRGHFRDVGGSPHSPRGPPRGRPQRDDKRDRHTRERVKESHGGQSSLCQRRLKIDHSVAGGTIVS